MFGEVWREMMGWEGVVGRDVEKWEDIESGKCFFSFLLWKDQRGAQAYQTTPLSPRSRRRGSPARESGLPVRYSISR